MGKPIQAPLPGTYDSYFQFETELKKLNPGAKVEQMYDGVMRVIPANCREPYEVVDLLPAFPGVELS